MSSLYTTFILEKSRSFSDLNYEIGWLDVIWQLKLVKYHLLMTRHSYIIKINVLINIHGPKYDCVTNLFPSIVLQCKSLPLWNWVTGCFWPINRSNVMYWQSKIWMIFISLFGFKFLVQNKPKDTDLHLVIIFLPKALFLCNWMIGCDLTAKSSQFSWTDVQKCK